MVPRYMSTQGWNVLGQIVTKRANTVPLWIWPMWPSKVGQIKNPGIMSCILNTRYTSDKNLRMIQSFVQELALYVFLAPWWPSQRTETWSVRSYHLGVHMYKVLSLFTGLNLKDWLLVQSVKILWLLSSLVLIQIVTSLPQWLVIIQCVNRQYI
jgi:hypothetical protein